MKKHPLKLGLILLASTLMLSACGHLMHLDRAQNTFNQGATLENQLRFSPQSEVSSSPYLYYNMAYAELGKALKNKTALGKDDVLANAYTIKALCEWKLKMYSRAEKSADAALEEYLDMERKGIAMPRDKALMQALPALMEIDKVKSHLFAFHAPDSLSYAAAQQHYQEYIHDSSPDKAAKLEAAIQRLGSVRAQLEGGNEEMVVYLVLSQLAALKTWSDGLDFLRQSLSKDPGLPPGAQREAREFRTAQREQHLTPLKDELLGTLRKLLPNDAPLVLYWSERI
jgi:uncharacterized protein with PIN domain